VVQNAVRPHCGMPTDGIFGTTRLTEFHLGTSRDKQCGIGTYKPASGRASTSLAFFLPFSHTCCSNTNPHRQATRIRTWMPLFANKLKT
jgi:hypothetical protein